MGSIQHPQQICPPDHSQKKLGGELGGTAHILGFFGQGVPFQRYAVHHVLDGAVEQLHQQAKHQRHGQQDGFRPVPPQPAGQGQADHSQQAYLPKSLLVLPGDFVAGQRIPRGIQQADQSPFSLQFVASIHTHSHSRLCCPALHACNHSGDRRLFPCGVLRYGGLLIGRPRPLPPGGMRAQAFPRANPSCGPGGPGRTVAVLPKHNRGIAASR